MPLTPEEKKMTRQAPRKKSRKAGKWSSISGPLPAPADGYGQHPINRSAPSRAPGPVGPQQSKTKAGGRWALGPVAPAKAGNGNAAAILNIWKKLFPGKPLPQPPQMPSPQQGGPNSGIYPGQWSTVGPLPPPADGYGQHPVPSQGSRWSLGPVAPGGNNQPPGSLPPSVQSMIAGPTKPANDPSRILIGQRGQAFPGIPAPPSLPQPAMQAPSMPQAQSPSLPQPAAQAPPQDIPGNMTIGDYLRGGPSPDFPDGKWGSASGPIQGHALPAGGQPQFVPYHRSLPDNASPPNPNNASPNPFTPPSNPFQPLQRNPLLGPLQSNQIQIPQPQQQPPQQQPQPQNSVSQDPSTFGVPDLGPAQDFYRDLWKSMQSQNQVERQPAPGMPAQVPPQFNVVPNPIAGTPPADNLATPPGELDRDLAFRAQRGIIEQNREQRPATSSEQMAHDDAVRKGLIEPQNRWYSPDPRRNQEDQFARIARNAGFSARNPGSRYSGAEMAREAQMQHRLTQAMANRAPTGRPLYESEGNPVDPVRHRMATENMNRRTAARKAGQSKYQAVDVNDAGEIVEVGSRSFRKATKSVDMDSTMGRMMQMVPGSRQAKVAANLKARQEDLDRRKKLQIQNAQGKRQERQKRIADRKAGQTNTGSQQGILQRLAQNNPQAAARLYLGQQAMRQRAQEIAGQRAMEMRRLEQQGNQFNRTSKSQDARTRELMNDRVDDRRSRERTADANLRASDPLRKSTIARNKVETNKIELSTKKETLIRADARRILADNPGMSPADARRRATETYSDTPPPTKAAIAKMDASTLRGNIDRKWKDGGKKLDNLLIAYPHYSRSFAVSGPRMGAAVMGGAGGKPSRSNSRLASSLAKRVVGGEIPESALPMIGQMLKKRLKPERIKMLAKSKYLGARWLYDLTMGNDLSKYKDKMADIRDNKGFIWLAQGK